MKLAEHAIAIFLGILTLASTTALVLPIQTKIITTKYHYNNDTRSTRPRTTTSLYAQDNPRIRGLQRQSKSILHDFACGVTYVHKNYLTIYWTLAERSIMAAVSTGTLLCIANFLSPHQSSLQETARLLSLPLQKLSRISDAYNQFCILLLLSPFFIILLPIAGLYLLSKRDSPGAVISPPNWFSNNKQRFFTISPRIDAYRSTLARMLRFVLNKYFETYSILSASALAVPSVLRVAVYAPLREEVFYRLIFYKLQKRLYQVYRYCSPNSYFDQPYQRRRTAVVSSTLFAVGHISNWYGAVPFYGTEQLNDSFRLILAMVQVANTFTVSLKVFCPLYEKSGLFASIGAHAAWNLLLVVWVVNLPLRILVRLYKLIKNKRETRRIRQS